MENNQREYIAKKINEIISALKDINFQCEKSPNLCDAIATGYPMENSLDEMILDFISWRECINGHE